LSIALLDNARDRAADRVIHIDIDSIRAAEVRGALPEEGAAVALEVAYEWLLTASPGLAAKFAKDFAARSEVAV
jgi:hypothetical protein